MATLGEPSSDEKPDPSMSSSSSSSSSSSMPSHGGEYILDKTVRALEEDTTPWIEYAVEQAKVMHKTLEDTFDSFVSYSGSRLCRIRSTSSAHFNQTLDSLEGVKSEYSVYEDIVFEKIKEGVLVAASNPLVTCAVVSGLGLMALKRPRRFLYYNTIRRFVSEESLLSKADTNVKELRKSIDLLKAESEKLERRAVQAEEEMSRGRMKLRQTGSQIQGVIRSAYKAERQAAGLKDILGELPSREASRFRSQVSNLASEAKRERNALSKEVRKISNYGISV